MKLKQFALVLGLALMAKAGVAHATSYQLGQTFLNPSPASGDNFGWSVAAVGNNVLVGAPNDDTGATDSGAAYLFDGDTGALLLTFLDPNPYAGARFGFSVAAVGNNVLIGAPGATIGGVNSGAAYLFDGATGALLLTFLNPTPNSGDQFGLSIASVGANVLIGAPRDDAGGTDAGAAYLFDGATGALLTTFMKPTPAAADQFGMSVAAIGTNVLIGAIKDATLGVKHGAVYLFDTSGLLLETFLNPSPALDDDFGWTVAPVGANVLVGAPVDDNAGPPGFDSGQAHLFDGTGFLLRTFEKLAPVKGDRFGYSVAALDASTLLMGTPFDDTGGADAGAVYIYDTAGTFLQTLQKSAPVAGDRFGYSVAALGDNIIVGAPRANGTGTTAGAVYLFTEAPTADPQTVTTSEGTPVAITLTGSDPNGDPVAFAVATSPANGVLSGTPPALMYTPNPGFNGADSFTFVVSDPWLASPAATVSIVVTPVNEAPVANPDNLGTMNENTVLVFPASALTANDTDADGDSLTVTAVTATASTHGTVTLAGGVITYTPNLSYSGPASFDYTIGDGNGGFSSSTASLTVIATNSAPTANSQSVTTLEDASVTITLTGSDPDGDPLTFTVATAPANGALSGTAPNLTYTPGANFNGSDSFTFTVSDGSLTSAPATVSISVTPVNDPPYFDPIANQAVMEDAGTQSVFITGVSAGPPDESGQTVTLSATSSNPTLVPNPTVTGAGSTRTLGYQPATDAYGSATITVVAQDDGGTANGGTNTFTRTFTISVLPVNDAPVAAADTYTVVEDNTLTVPAPGVLANDADADSSTLTAVLVSGPANGALTLNADGSFTYTPNPNFTGSDSFTYTASDGSLNSDTATVTITVTAVNDAPTANTQSVTTPEDTSVVITLTGSDIEGSALSFTVTVAPSYGTLGPVTVTGPATATVTYTPAVNYTGPDSFLFTVNDGSADSPQATIAIAVSPVNDGPIANAQSVTTNEDVAVPVTLTGSDPEGDPLTFSVATGPANGTLSGTAPNLTYTPNPNFSGSDSFTFTVSDGSLTSSPATVTLTVNPINDTPAATAFSDSTPEDTPKTLTLLGSDPEGDPLAFTIVSAPAHGSLGPVVGSSVTYTPAANFNGTDSFTFTVSDGSLTSSPATVTLTVTPVNDPPTATSQSVTTAEDTSVVITLAGSDPEGDPLTFSVTSGPANGTLSGSGAVRTYTPNPNFTGSDSFTFTVSDGSLTSSPATVSINVTPAGNGTPGRMHGEGRIDKLATRYHYEFQVWENLAGRERGHLKYSVCRPRPGGDHDDRHDERSGRDSDGHDDDRDHQRSGRDHDDHDDKSCDRFVSTAINSAVFSDSPGIDPKRPRSRVDTVVFTGVGRWNGRPGYTFEARATDAGEPGHGRDTFSITVRAPSGAIVSTVSGILKYGNNQAHGARR